MQITTKIPMPEMIEVESSNLRAFGYDPDTKDLFIAFKTKAVYTYEKVEQKVFDEIKKAHDDGESVGRKFIALVRSQNYAFNHVGQVVEE